MDLQLRGGNALMLDYALEPNSFQSNEKILKFINLNSIWLDHYIQIVDNKKTLLFNSALSHSLTYNLVKSSFISSA